MTGPVTFEILGRPVPKGRPRFDPRSGRVYTPAKTVQYEKNVANHALVAGVRLKGRQTVKVTVVAFLGRHPWPDPDNVLKSILDGIGLANREWNDRYATHSSVRFLAAVDGKQFARVTVEEIGHVK